MALSVQHALLIIGMIEDWVTCSARNIVTIDLFNVVKRLPLEVCWDVTIDVWVLLSHGSCVKAARAPNAGLAYRAILATLIVVLRCLQAAKART